MIKDSLMHTVLCIVIFLISVYCIANVTNKHTDSAKRPASWFQHLQFRIMYLFAHLLSSVEAFIFDITCTEITHYTIIN